MAKKKRRKAPVNQMTLDWCRSRDWMIGRTEYKIRFNVTKDLFGFIDFVAVRPEVVGVLAIQVTTFENRLARVKKILNETNVEALNWLRSGNQIEVWGWKRPSTKNRMWALKRECVIINKGGELESISEPLILKQGDRGGA
tara:strand:- start:128 stop:550 length:423 start_codon:yes stop_codon:yes gene_type:complete